MQKTRVIVMSFKGRQTITYTDDGQFIYIPRKEHHQVGQVLSIENPATSARRYNPGWKSMIAAAAAVMLFLFGMFYPLTPQQAEAYFSLGLNKGNAELWVDKDNRVIDVKYADAAQLETLEVKGKDVYQAISEIATEARKTGLLDETDENLLLLNFADMSKNGHQINEEKMKEAVLNSFNSDRSQPLMVMSRHEKDFLLKAGEMGLTTSQYYIYEQGKSKGLPLTAEQLKHVPIRSALKKVGTTPEELFGMPGMPKDAGENRGMMPAWGKSPATSLPNATSAPEHTRMQQPGGTPAAGTFPGKQGDKTPMQEPQHQGNPEQGADHSSIMQNNQGNMQR